MTAPQPARPPAEDRAGHRLLKLLAAGAAMALIVGGHSYFLYREVEEDERRREERDAERRRQADRMVRDVVASSSDLDRDRIGAMSQEELVQEMMSLRLTKSLIEDLGSDDPEKRRTAALLLGCQRRYAERVIPALEKLLEDEDEGARRAAAQALEMIKAHSGPSTPSTRSRQASSGPAAQEQE
jgi:HEAT repeat protein